MRHFLALALLALAFALAAYLLTADSSEDAQEAAMSVPAVHRAADPEPMPDPMNVDPNPLRATITVDSPEQVCPNGSSLSIRLWDTLGVMWSGSARELTAPIDPPSSRGRRPPDIINATLFCRDGQGEWEGQISPMLTSATVGSGAESIGVHVRVNGEDHPAFICWDTVNRRGLDPNFHRIQFLARDAGQTGCSPDTL